MSKILIVDDEVQILVIAGPPYDNWNSKPPT